MEGPQEGQSEQIYEGRNLLVLLKGSFRIGVWYQNCGSLGWMQIESVLHVKVTRNNSGKHLFGMSLDTVQWMLVI